MKFILTICLILFFVYKSESRILNVGNGQIYSHLTVAATQAQAGDTILISEGQYNGGIFIANLQGTAFKPIYIIGDGDVSFVGGNSTWQFSSAQYLTIENIKFREATSNVLNFDDAANYGTAHNIKFKHCSIGNIKASGNNDLLKLSGIDSLTIQNCEFSNGAAGGSMIDMVGCHNVFISDNKFENAGSNAIQAKGGSSEIFINRNIFLNAGARAINIGGSTGLAFFRPIDAEYESANIEVSANIFIGGDTPIAFVGTMNSKVINNTIINPSQWAFRILQENTDARFVQCKENTFSNNIIYFQNSLKEGGTNIGANTLPATFEVANNLWYSVQNPTWNNLNKNLVHQAAITGINPLFANVSQNDFGLTEESPCINAGKSYVLYSNFDYTNREFAKTPSIGAFQYFDGTSVKNYEENDKITLYPNPTFNEIYFESNSRYSFTDYAIYSNEGKRIQTGILTSNTININSLAAGQYYLVLTNSDKNRSFHIIEKK